MKKALLLAAALLLVPVAANAHAGVISVAPAADGILTEMPSEIRLTFTEELLTIDGSDVNTVMLNSFDGPKVELTDIKVIGNILSATIPAADYAPGTYEITYRIVSADGHKLSDSYIFSLNAPVRNQDPSAVERGGSDGLSLKLGLPIFGAILILLIVAGFLLLRSRNRKA